jgi:AcrR family transcriptional regulator
MGAGWEQISTVAGELFLAHGFVSVSQREIAAAVGIKAASLYHHCPGGKAELYERSVQDAMARLRGALEQAAGDLPVVEALPAIAEAMLANPPVDFRRIAEVDLPALAAAGGTPDHVMGAVHAGAHEPIRDALARGRERGELRADLAVDVAAAAVISLVAGLGWAHGQDATPMVRAALDLLLVGIRAR